MKNETTLIGWFTYSQKNTNKKMVCFMVIAQPINENRGSGYYIKNFYCEESQGLHLGLKAGKVKIETNAWNSNILEAIKNI